MGKGIEPVRQHAAKLGRPRVLTLDDIVEAAQRTGLNNLKMPALAAELGIGAGTLYNYVDSRDELLRLVAMRRLRPPHVDNGTDDWREMVRTHARVSFSYWVDEPEFIDQFMRGVVGPDIMLDNLESFVTSLVSRGFEPREAYIVISAVNTFCFGAIVRHHYATMAMNSEGKMRPIIRDSLRKRGADELPNLRAIFDTAEDPHFDFNILLEVTIKGLAAQLSRD